MEMKFPKNVTLSEEGKDFIRRLTVKNKKKRMGRNGVKEIMGHSWF